MRSTISGSGVQVDEKLRQYIERRLHFTLGRFGPDIDQVVVRVADINGSRGGVDKECRVVVRLRGRGNHRIAVDDHDDNVYAAVARAIARSGRSVARTVERRRDRRSYPSREVAVAEEQ